MDESEGVHLVTEQTYKHLVENFTPALKQFLLAGKAYHRALQAVSHCHKAYIDSLAKLCPPSQHDGYSIGPDVNSNEYVRNEGNSSVESLDLSEHQMNWVTGHLGHTMDVHKIHYRGNLASLERCQVAKLLLLQDTGRVGDFCNKTLDDIQLSGGALHQITDLFKEVHSLNNEYMQSFSSELLSPLEEQQDNEYKNTINDQKKYGAGNKYHSQTIEKARGSLSKVQKRGKTKGKMQPKEMELLKSVSDRQTLLADYRIESCKKVLMEERRRYCLLLERLCHVTSSQSNATRRTYELLHQHLPRWVDLSRKPNTLPERTDALLKSCEIIDDGEYSDKSVARLTPEGSLGMSGPRSDGHVPNGIPSGRYTEVASVGPTMPSPMKGPPIGGKLTGATLPRTITVPSPVSAQGRPQVRAIYTHIGKGDHTLSFTETDIITLIGEAKEGWQYGENTRSNRFGWFPIAFTEPMDQPRTSPGLDQNKALSKSADQLNNGFDNPIYDSRPDPNQYHASPVMRRPHHQSRSNYDDAPMGSPFMERHQQNPLYHAGPPSSMGPGRPISMYNLPAHLASYDTHGGLNIPEMIQEERKSMPDIRPMQNRVPAAPPPPPPPPGPGSRFQPVHRTSPTNLGQDPYGHPQKPHAQHAQGSRGSFDQNQYANDRPPQAPPQPPPRPPPQQQQQHNSSGYNQYQEYDPYGYLSGRPPPNPNTGNGYQQQQQQGNGYANDRGESGNDREPSGNYLSRQRLNQHQQQYGNQNGHMVHPPADYDDVDDQSDNQFARQKQLLRKAATNDRSGPHIRR